MTARSEAPPAVGRVTTGGLRRDVHGALAVVAMLAAAALTPAAEQPALARNVVLFLADAGGLPTLNAASLHGYGEGRRLFVQRMPHIGLSDTAAAAQLVTDSAAGMTAIVTGRRTHNGVIGQGPDAVRGVRDGTPLKTILEYAEERGLATGLISNDSLAGATPAALYAKVHERNLTAAIFRQALTPRLGDGIDVLIGSGRPAIAAALTAAGSSLDQLATAAGRPILDRLDAVPAGGARAVVLLEDTGFDVGAAVTLARRLLATNPRGYFLMVESDVHTDTIRRGLDRMVAFDRVIEQTAATAGADTLVLFTADHSFDLRIHDGRRGRPLLTGAAAEQGGGAASIRLPHVRMDNDHTGEEVLVAAQGPGADRVRGFMANTDLFHVMLAAFGWAREGQ
ncbi:MAG: alkaline phosphatase [Vicinamibacterales bacterium]